jgi:hypothetical protein
MAVAHRYPPDHVPVLSRGKHRSPRKGACFMEFASYLAGERWSDHPPCTHHLSDEARQQLAPLVPSVIGLTSDDLHVDARLALLCARTALPVVAAEQQRVMAVGVLSCERVLAHLDQRPGSRCEEASRRALEQAPEAAAWARRFTTELSTSVKGFRRVAAPSIVLNAVKGIAEASTSDPDALLRDLLVEAINECRALITPPAASRPVDLPLP